MELKRIEVSVFDDHGQIALPMPWNTTMVLKRIEEVLRSADHATEITLSLHAEMDSVPQLEYTIVRYILPRNGEDLHDK